MSGRKDFLSQPAPENYVAGLGRGATGFTTRSDLGPAREGPSEDQIKAALQKRAEQLGAAAPSAYGVPEKKEENDDDDERFQDPENETGLFASGDFTREDDEADRIFQDVDERMEKRRKSRREAREAQERADYEANNPKIQQQFADLKRGLASMSEEDWSNLPEPGDLTRRNKRAKTAAHQRFYAVPDSVIAGARDSTQLETSITDDGGAANGSGTDNVDGTLTNVAFAEIGKARDKQLQLRLDQATNAGTDLAAGTSTNIDPKGYLTSLTKSDMKAGEVEVGDINRVRLLLESVIKTNKHHAPGHIALARLEELGGSLQKARNAIMQGCELCPSSEDAWLENIRLHQGGDNHNARVVAARSLTALPHSTRLWQECISLEPDLRSQQRCARKSLDINPKSVQLWKRLINMSSDEEEATLLFAKAVEEIPLSIDLWLGFASTTSTKDPVAAQKILNKARLQNPSSYQIWIAALVLSEQTGNTSVNIMRRAVQSLARENAMLKREEWIVEAEKLEENDHILSLQGVIRETLGFGLDENDEDNKRQFLEDSRASLSRGKPETAKAICAYCLRLYPTSRSAWNLALEIEKDHGTRDSYWQLLEKSIEAVPSSEELWTKLAREKWEAGNPDEARKVLARAFNQFNNNNENIYLQAVRLETDAKAFDKARDLLADARQGSGTDRIWYKSVHFERQQGNAEVALDLVSQALDLFPRCAKLFMQKGQILAGMGKVSQAREAYNVGTRACPTSVPLYLLLSRLDEASSLVKARSDLERGHLATKSAAVALEQVRIERRAGNLNQAKVLMAKALQAHGSSGALWSESIWHLEPRTQRKPRSLEAIKKVDNDPTLFVTVARVFWGERKLEKAANWFEKAILLDADLGDTWAWYYKFLAQHGTEEKRAEVVEKCRASEPSHGEVWQAVNKDPKNAGMSTEEVLMKVVGMLD